MALEFTRDVQSLVTGDRWINKDHSLT